MTPIHTLTHVFYAEVNIEMISQGASEINISVVVDALDASKVLQFAREDGTHFLSTPLVASAVVVQRML